MTSSFKDVGAVGNRQRNERRRLFVVGVDAQQTFVFRCWNQLRICLGIRRLGENGVRGEDEQKNRQTKIEAASHIDSRLILPMSTGNSLKTRCNNEPSGG